MYAFAAVILALAGAVAVYMLRRRGNNSCSAPSKTKSPTKANLLGEDCKPEFTENPRFRNEGNGANRGIGPASRAGRVALAAAQAATAASEAVAAAPRPPLPGYPPNPADMGSGSGGSGSQKDSYKLQVRPHHHTIIQTVPLAVLLECSGSLFITESQHR